MDSAGTKREREAKTEKRKKQKTPEKKRGRFLLGTVALWEIRKFQKSTCFLIRNNNNQFNKTGAKEKKLCKQRLYQKYAIHRTPQCKCIDRKHRHLKTEWKWNK